MNAPCGTRELTWLNAFSPVSPLLSDMKWEEARCWDSSATFPTEKTAQYSMDVESLIFYHLV
jgi:hypothetical protein